MEDDKRLLAPRVPNISNLAHRNNVHTLVTPGTNTLCLNPLSSIPSIIWHKVL